jgi:protein TonB
LEKDKSLNYLMGIVIALAILFVGFEWGESDLEVSVDTGISNIIDEEEIEATEQNEPPPPAPEPEVIKAPDIIEIVENNIEVETVNFTSEDDASHAQQETYVPPVEQKEEEVDDDFIFMSVEKNPEFPGGEQALMKWINEHIVYPTIAAENGIYGRVSCQFVVNADGSVTDVEVIRPVNQYLDREAIRVLKMLPKFKPGEQRGKPVRVRFSVPVRFQLNQ